MIRRIPVSKPGRMIDGDARPSFGPHMIRSRDDDFLINDAQGINVGVAGVSGHEVAVLMLLRKSDPMPHGMGLCYQFTTDEARTVGQSLIALADRIEAEAATQAAAALARAAGKGGA